MNRNRRPTGVAMNKQSRENRTWKNTPNKQLSSKLLNFPVGYHITCPDPIALIIAWISAQKMHL